MTDLNPTAERIMDAAEARMRKSGYNAVSFRDLAADVGIKSASVHYHFPQKEDLGVALVARYANRMMAVLETETDGVADPRQKLDIFIDVYRRSLSVGESICLCGMLGAESAGLPEPIIGELRSFFSANVSWLSTTLAQMGHDTPDTLAASLVSTLEGALIVASVMGDPTVFENAAETVRALAA